MKLAAILLSAGAFGLQAHAAHESISTEIAKPCEPSVLSQWTSVSVALEETPEEREERKRLEARLKAETEQARAALKAALTERDKKPRMEALAKYGRVADSKLIKLVAGALDDREKEVVEAALDALRYNTHKDALEALHRTWRRDKQMREHEELGPKLIKSIGQHGSDSSIDLLTDGIFVDEDERELAEARVLSLGNIRTRKSVETLLDLMNSGQKRYIQRHMSNMRLSMMMLTGTDKGDSVEAWMLWWNENKKEFAVADKPPLLPRASQERWDRFWGIERRVARDSKREDRGK